MTGIIVIPIGVFVGLAIGLWDKISGALLDVFRFFTSIPALAWLPLFLVWFGFNEATVIMTVAYYFFFTVLFNTLSGIRTVPRVLQYAVLTMGGNRWQVIRHVLIPGAMPSIIAGIRLGFAYGWRGLIGAEMLVAQGGLGHLIFRAQSVGLTDRIIAGMVVIGLLAALIDYLIMQPIEEATIRRWGLIQR
ncbi:ABC transporter permease [Thermaerobacter composti]|uniref:ABC transporter permease subunit n=1 Tax=Thermaerobacter composti TaxID=554949 RepID=A0ABZ0QM10_9FIRM|nr:ABC transporter permease subunit [Thermaerobacter composti]WPD18524.1 ABC transporter permease subunit [Thermaerobacter composti]